MRRHRISALRWAIVTFCLVAALGVGIELPSAVSARSRAGRATASSVSSTHGVVTINRQRPSAGPQPYISRDWTQYGFSAQHTGYNPYERTIGVSNVSRLTVAWSDTTELASSVAFAVANGVAYTETDDGTFYALDAATGALLWMAAIGNTISDPAVANGVVYFTAADGYLYALNAAGCGALTCTWLWRTTLQEFSQANLTIANGVIYVATTDGSHVAAYNATNGTLLWSTPISSTGDAFFSAPTVANNVVYVGAAALYTFDVTTGSLLWTGKVNNANEGFTGSVVVQSGVAYLTTNMGNLYAFNASGCGSATCSASWISSAGTAIIAAPAVANGRVYVAGSGAFYAFNAAGCGSATCSALWTSALSDPTFEYANSSPTVANGVVYFGTNLGHLYALAAGGCGKAQCSALWTYALGGLAGSTPIVVNGMLYEGVFNYSANTDEKFYGFSVPAAPGML